ncbi:Prolamin-like domain [Macleaya cordata]|uniref:Prolamin-like domain n=1 Tax=Macleaya cordata TaxID=56857 RepID=A0A200QPL4_MACCD|nr:Prolamin-like domain [Macleaya cordata]
MAALGLGSDAADAPSNVIDLGTIPTNPHEGLPPEPYPGYYDYLDFCTAKVPVECGGKLVEALLNTNEASYDCCQNLIEMGKDCHDTLVKTIASMEEYKSYASILPQRGSEVWNYCAHVAAAAPTPSLV